MIKQKCSKCGGTGMVYAYAGINGTGSRDTIEPIKPSSAEANDAIRRSHAEAQRQNNPKSNPGDQLSE